MDRGAQIFDKMSNLVEISSLVTQSVDFFSIKDKIIEKMLKVIHPTKACINLFYNDNYEYAYLVCSDTLEVIPDIYPLNSKIGRRIKFNDYPKYIHEAVKDKKIIRIDDIDSDKRAIDEKNLAIKEGYSGRIVFPLIVSDKVVGFMTCFLEKEDFVEESDIDFISSVASLVSLSIHITNRNKKTEILIDKLRSSISAINEATKKLYENKNINEFLDDLSKKACHITKSEECAIIIEKDIDDKKMFSFYSKKNSNNQSHIYPIISKIQQFEESNFYKNNVSLSENINSFIFNKLEDDRKIIGYIVCANSKNYTEDDLNIINIFSKQLYVAIKIFEYNLKEMNHQILTNELELLSNQQKLLMNEKKIKKDKNKELNFYHKPAKVVGGDFYYCTQKEDKLIYIVADVMGHGMVSNYVVAIIKGAFKVLSNIFETTDEIMSNLNSMLYDEFDKMGIFVTCVIAIVDYKNQTLNISNAGHYNPIITDNDNKIIRNLNFKKGVPLGIIESSNYESNILNLNEISSVWMYTDGIIEVRNDKKEEFSIERFENFIINNIENSHSDIVNNLEKELINFCNKENYNDDILTVILKNK